MTKRFKFITGFVLAGGASRRMGCDKTKLVLGSETFLARQVRLLRAVCRTVVVVGARENPTGPALRVIADVFPGCGPLGGIHAGLLQSRTEYNLFLGCDMPFITPRFLCFLAAHALASKSDITAAESRHGRLQPLCAVYRRRAVTAIGLGLKAGNYKASAFCHRARCRALSWTELARSGFRPNLFANLNTPEDYQAAKRCAGPAV
jgi:molybdopterin-guanine dinucleotide biosynthesis protein A